MRPATLAELRDAVRDTDGPLLVCGAGTAAGWAGTPSPDAARIETTGLAGITTYNPDDMTVAVRAGTPLAWLQAELASHGQRIALDAARVPAGGTVGGLVATADSGPLRHSHGGPRDLVIGVTVVLADGTVARSGGHVIKNVAGYDLGKLFCGSFGTLGVLAEVVLRVHPLPPATRTVALPCDAVEALDAVGRVLAARLEPVALEWCDGSLLARYEGGPSSVERRASATLLHSAGTVLDPTEEAEAWRRVSEVSDEPTVVRCGTRPDQFPYVAKHATRVTSSVAVGVHTVAVAGAAEVERLRAEFEHVTLCRRPPGSDLPAWGRPHASVPLMRAVKQQFDPAGRLGVGRFAPWF
ncbi:FAD-binding oxidoreductase [Phytohabitans aurantiacus]|jgi:glycolate oxidase FAD binding subunit|uniref:Glycolate oxidase n=1 Tax=Phytohabitans aurantiacus TaxID=3016789 RepID=A0ABQ5QKX1_9ACTN|nr:FAD-binding protein [Phytohabitans aurantiacus]GLH94789.1 glycolate oxidase [Phytohabitans aurantiacus]